MGRLIENGTVVHCLWDSLQRGESGLQALPGLVKRCLREECWRERFVERLKDVVACRTFEEFVGYPPPEGLGTDLRTLKNLCRDDTEARDMIDKATSIKPGQHRANDNVSSSQGNSKDAALRRLRKDRPDLHRQVIAGKKSAHAAMIEAGFRKPPPMPLDLGKRAWAKMTAAERAEFLGWLDTPEANP